jgi:hypothetical protein
MKKILFGLGTLMFASTAFAWVQISAGTITALGSGWYFDNVWVTTTGQPLAQLGCVDNAKYKKDPNLPERKAHHATLMLAYAMGKAVVLTIDGCIGDYPRVVGVEIPVQ